MVDQWQKKHWISTVDTCEVDRVAGHVSTCVVYTDKAAANLRSGEQVSLHWNYFIKSYFTYFYIKHFLRGRGFISKRRRSAAGSFPSWQRRRVSSCSPLLQNSQTLITFSYDHSEWAGVCSSTITPWQGEGAPGVWRETVEAWQM